VLTRARSRAHTHARARTSFSLLSLVQTKPFDISSAVFNNDMLNATSVMVIISMACGYLVFLLERKNSHLGTAPRGVYWSIMTFLTVSGAREALRPEPTRTRQKTSAARARGETPQC
jgi:hypothetical protein